MVICDFAENYAFVVQDAVQGFHWNNNQATIHPFVIYYKTEEKVKTKSFVIISEHLKHGTIDVYLFQKCLIEYLKVNFEILYRSYITLATELLHNIKIEKTSLTCVIMKKILKLKLSGISLQRPMGKAHVMKS